MHQNSVTFVVSRSSQESFFERFLGTDLCFGECPRSLHNTQQRMKAVTTNNKTPTKIMITDKELESAIGNNISYFVYSFNFVVN